MYVKYKCGGAPEVTHFYVLLYLDRLMARPVEIWQVCMGVPCSHVAQVFEKHEYALLHTSRAASSPSSLPSPSPQMFAHCLRKVDMRAVIGQTSQASVVIRGAQSTRRVACYSSHPDELQVDGSRGRGLGRGDSGYGSPGLAPQAAGGWE